MLCDYTYSAVVDLPIGPIDSWKATMWTVKNLPGRKASTTYTTYNDIQYYHDSGHISLSPSPSMYIDSNINHQEGNSDHTGY